MKDTAILALADRMITHKGVPTEIRKKLIDIPYLNATVSYYGLAGFPLGAKEWEMAEFLRQFIRRSNSIDNLGDFSMMLREELAKIIPRDLLKTNPSGFHICGYGKGRLPELWHLTNVGNFKNFRYGDFHSSYLDPSEDFLGRDAPKYLKWEKGTLKTREQRGGRTYRNGDVRAHVLVYELLDDLMKNLFQFDDFSGPQDIMDYASYCKFKFEIISFIYKKWAKNQIIGRPIDVMVTCCKLDNSGNPSIKRYIHDAKTDSFIIAA